MRETLDEGLGSELTGNAFADLAQLELDDFVGRTSMQPKKMEKMMGHDSLTIEEIEEDDHSSHDPRNNSKDWRNPSKTISLSNSKSSSRSDASTSSSKSKGIGRKGRRMLSRAAQSTRKMIIPSKNRHRHTASLDTYSENDQASACAVTSALSRSVPSPSEPLFPPKPHSMKKTRYVSDPIMTHSSDDDEDVSTGMSKLPPKEKMKESKEMNKEPRRHFSKWNKIKSRLEKSK